MNRDDDNDRFGMPDSAFKAAAEAHAGIVRVGMFVPTRAQVRTMEPNELRIVLDLWMHESPVELIPSSAQIAGVIYELKRRPDSHKKAVVQIISACRSYLA